MTGTAKPDGSVGAASCGLDFGTSNSTIGVISGGNPSLIALEAHTPMMPSVVYFSSTGLTPSFGISALEAHGEDQSGRLIRSIKSVLGSSLMTGGDVADGSGTDYVTILRLFLGAMKSRAEEAVGGALRRAVVGRPVRFVDKSDPRDQAAQDELERSLKQTGFDHIEFEFEPVAAARHLAVEDPRAVRILVIDVGGGTTDFSIILNKPSKSTGASDFSVLATGSVHEGGNDVDQVLALATVARDLGYRAALNDPGRTLPDYPYLDLTKWHRIPQIYKPAIRRSLLGFRCDVQDVRLIDRMLDILARRAGHALLEKVENAKIALATAHSVDVHVDDLKDPVSRTLNTHELGECFENVFGSVRGVLADVLKQAQLKSTQVDTVLLTGGSSALRGWASMIEGAFPGARLVRNQPFSRVGLGLTLRAREIFG
ncbi:MAG: Hsp70 family protein [Pseudomonadota bacterium]